LTLLDAYAVVAFVADEPAAAEVEELLRAGGARIVVANLAEAIDVCRRVHDLGVDDLRGALEPLLLARALSPLASQERDAWSAAELRRTYYDRGTRAISLADCFLLAHARDAGEPIATADPPVAEVASAEGIAIVALPDSAGRRP
jgi:PIN domain nuclease of toxin-antitoxin system